MPNENDQNASASSDASAAAGEEAQTNTNTENLKENENENFSSQNKSEFKNDSENKNDLEENDKDSNKEKEKNRPEHKNHIGAWIVAAICVLALTISFTLYLSSPKDASKGEVQSRSTTMIDVGFDTPVTFKTTSNEADFDRWLQIVRDTFLECSAIFDAVNPPADDTVVSLYTINNAPRNTPFEVDEKMIEVYNDALQIHAVNNKFDPAQGNLTALWRAVMDESDPVLPSAQEVEDAINKDSVNGVKVDGNTITLTGEDAALDFGAIAKGYTAQLAADRLVEAGLEEGLINAGGNVVLIGHKPDGKNWKVGIQDPDGSDSLLTCSLADPSCFVTSGDYQRYVLIDGHRYAHIVDPTTGYPARYMRSVTVVDQDSAYCDGMSTALFCMSVEDGLALCKKIGLQAIWIVDKGTVNVTPDLSTDTFDIYLTDGMKDLVTLKAK